VCVCVCVRGVEVLTGSTVVAEVTQAGLELGGRVAARLVGHGHDGDLPVEKEFAVTPVNRGGNDTLHLLPGGKLNLTGRLRGRRDGKRLLDDRWRAEAALSLYSRSPGPVTSGWGWACRAIKLSTAFHSSLYTAGSIRKPMDPPGLFLSKWGLKSNLYSYFYQ